MLTIEQRAVTDSKIIAGSRNTEDWLRFLADFLSEYDMQFDLQEKQKRKTALASRIFWGSPSVIAILIIFTDASWWLASFALLPLSWYLLRKYQENAELYDRVPTIPRLKENVDFLTSTLYFLSQEAKKETLITISLNLDNIFRNVEARKKNDASTKNGKDYRFNGYEMVFLTLKTNFSDKTTVQLTIQNKIKETHIIKKSRKGRSKTSTKRINQTIYKVNVGFSTAQYQPKPNVIATQKKERYWLTSQTDTILEENSIDTKDLVQYNNKYLWGEIAKNYVQMNIIK